MDRTEDILARFAGKRWTVEGQPLTPEDVADIYRRIVLKREKVVSIRRVDRATALLKKAGFIVFSRSERRWVNSPLPS